MNLGICFLFVLALYIFSYHKAPYVADKVNRYTTSNATNKKKLDWATCSPNPTPNPILNKAQSSPNESLSGQSYWKLLSSHRGSEKQLDSSVEKNEARAIFFVFSAPFFAFQTHTRITVAPSLTTNDIFVQGKDGMLSILGGYRGGSFFLRHLSLYGFFVENLSPPLSIRQGSIQHLDHDRRREKEGRFHVKTRVLQKTAICSHLEHRFPMIANC